MRILTDIVINQSPRWGKETEYINSNHHFNLKYVKKYEGILRPILETLEIIKHARIYDVVITGNIKTAQFIGFLKKLFKLDKPKHIVLELMLDEEKNTIPWKLKKIFQGAAFGGVDVIFVSSTYEVEKYTQRFSLPQGRVRFLPFHTDIIEPRMVAGTEDFILSVGKTGRDYTTLASAVKDIDTKVVVVSDAESIKGIKFSPNVEVLSDIPYHQYLNLLERCRIVVVPLKKLVKSTGQVVILEAMGLGKPVIATLTTGTVDYIKDGVNGLLVPVEDSEALRSGIKRLVSDPELLNNIASNALKSVRENYTFDMYTSRILETAKEIAGDEDNNEK